LDQIADVGAPQSEDAGLVKIYCQVHWRRLANVQEELLSRPNFCRSIPNCLISVHDRHRRTKVRTT